MEGDGREGAEEQEEEVLEEEWVGGEGWRGWVGGGGFFDAGPGEVDVEEEEEDA